MPALLLMVSACGGGSGSDNGLETGVEDDGVVQNTETVTVGDAATYSDITLDLNRVIGDDERAAVDQYGVWFPEAIVVPPKIANGGLPGWYDIGTDDFSRYVHPSRSVPLLTDPHFFQFRENAADYNNSLEELLRHVEDQIGFSLNSDAFIEIEAYGYVFGDTLRAGFNSVVFNGANIDWFVDVLSMADGSVIVNVFYATEAVFSSWDGILMPLVFNDYVTDPGIFVNRDVFLAGTDKQKTDFYSAMVNTRVMSDFGSFVILSNAAQQAMDNAVTISECAAASNCTISYVNGRAVSNYG